MFIQQGNTRYETPDALESILKPLGLTFSEWDINDLDTVLCQRATTDATAQQQVMAVIQEPLDALKAENGYLTEDVISLSPQTPNLEAILAQFDREHHHTDDEVRVILHGKGIFGIIPNTASNTRAFEVHVFPGDLLVVPAYTRHWFKLYPDKEIIALRVFMTPAGWQALYEPESAQMAVGTIA